jgi:hypothetical protein
MAAAGTAILDFGAYPGTQEASVVVTGQGAILAGSNVEAWWMSDTTSDHTANDHAYAQMFVYLTCGTVVASTGFTINARCEDKMQGTFQVRWIWA